jgi:hypothetical protein
MRKLAWAVLLILTSVGLQAQTPSYLPANGVSTTGGKVTTPTSSTSGISGSSKGSVTSNNLYANAPYPYFLSVEADSNGRDSELEETSVDGAVSQLVSHVPGVNYLHSDTEYCYSPGDCIPYIIEAYGNGVSAAQNEGMDWHIRLQENGYVYQGTLNSYSCTTSPVVCSLNMTQTQGQPQPQFGLKGNLGVQLGESTQIIDVSQGYSTGTITNIPNAGGPGCCNNPLTGTGVNWDSTFGDTFAKAVTTAAIDNNGGNTNLFPRHSVTIPTGTWTGTFAASSTPVCIFDETDTRYQCAKITSAVANTSITVDNLQWPITSGSHIDQGGLSGYCFSMDIDTVTSSSQLGYGNPTDSQVVNPIRRCFPIEYNTSGNTLSVYVNNDGELQFTTVANPSLSGAANYHIYPMAMIQTVLNSATGNVDGGNVLTTPFVGTFNTGDTLESPHYPSVKGGNLDWASNSWQSGPGWTGSFGFATGGSAADKGFPQGTLANYNDPRMYYGLPSGISKATTPGYGAMSTIGGYALNGPYAYGLSMNMPPFGEYNNVGAVYVACGGPYSLNAWCQDWNQAVYLLTVQNRGGVSGANYPYAEDSLSYNPYSYIWSVTAGGTGPNGSSNTCTQEWTPTGWTQTGSACSTVGQGMPLLAPIAVETNISTAFNVGTTAPAGLPTNSFGFGWTDLLNGASAGYSWFQGPGKNSSGQNVKYNIMNSGGGGWQFCTYNTASGPVVISTPSQLDTCHILPNTVNGTGTFDTIMTAAGTINTGYVPLGPNAFTNLGTMWSPGAVTTYAPPTNGFMPGIDLYNNTGYAADLVYGADSSNNQWWYHILPSSASGWKSCNYPATTASSITQPSQLTYCHTLSQPTVNDSIVTEVSNAITSSNTASGMNGPQASCVMTPCTNISGSYQVTSTTFTTGVFLTLVWPTTTNPYKCLVTQDGGTGFFSISHSVPTATGMTISAGITIAAQTFIVDYMCSAN